MPLGKSPSQYFKVAAIPISGVVLMFPASASCFGGGMKKIKERPEHKTHERAGPRSRGRTARSQAARTRTRIAVKSAAEKGWNVPVAQTKASVNTTQARRITIAGNHAAFCEDRSSAETPFERARRLATEVARFFSSFRRAIA